jgi:hypothetical protein
MSSIKSTPRDNRNQGRIMGRLNRSWLKTNLDLEIRLRLSRAYGPYATVHKILRYEANRIKPASPVKARELPIKGMDWIRSLNPRK